jgi:hypothetical protein
VNAHDGAVTVNVGRGDTTVSASRRRGGDWENEPSTNEDVPIGRGKPSWCIRAGARVRAKRRRVAKQRSQFAFAALPGATAKEHRKLLGQGGGSASATPSSTYRVTNSATGGKRRRTGSSRTSQVLQTVRVDRAFVAREVPERVRAQRRLPRRKRSRSGQRCFANQSRRTPLEDERVRDDLRRVKS